MEVDNISIVEKIWDAGIVGFGGAGFPTHAKLKGRIEYLIINVAECEPLLRTDRYIMRNEASSLIRTLAALKEELCIPSCVIALKEHYHEEANALRKAIAEENAPIRLHLMESFYPAGDEQTIVYEVTGKAVPPGGIPIAVGDRVRVGRVIAQPPEGALGAIIHASITGRVVSVGERIVIEKE